VQLFRPQRSTSAECGNLTLTPRGSATNIALSLTDWLVAVRTRSANRTAGTVGQALTEFAERYADQNERDYEAFLEEIRSGRLVASLDPS
jgi:hypothetical protein